MEHTGGWAQATKANELANAAAAAASSDVGENESDEYALGESAALGVDGLGQRQQRKQRMSAASLAAALELTDLESAQQRFGGGAFLPILPLGSDEDSSRFDGLTTLGGPTSTARWGLTS